MPGDRGKETAEQGANEYGTRHRGAAPAKFRRHGLEKNGKDPLKHTRLGNTDEHGDPNDDPSKKWSTGFCVKAIGFPWGHLKSVVVVDIQEWVYDQR